MRHKNVFGSLVGSSVLTVVALAAGSLPAQDVPCGERILCPEFNSSPYCRTSGFWFEAEDAPGAVGDVVGVTIWLHFAPGFDLEFGNIYLAVCHDPRMVELIGPPVYAEEVLHRGPIMVQFFPVAEDRNARHEGFGFHAEFGAMRDRSPVDGALPLLTVYYQFFAGAPGEESRVSFCDGEALIWGPASCNFSAISNPTILSERWPLLSTRNRDGTLTVREGPPTQLDRPPVPPDAVVYPEPLSSDQVNLRVRIGDALAVPGERGVPVDVFLAADVEYTGVIVPIDFDERYVEVARVEDNFLAGTAVIDNEDAVAGAQAEEGYAVIVSSIGGTRRIAPAGEEFHAATIYLDVLESASAVAETRLEARPVGGRAGDPFVIVRHLEGDLAGEVEARGEYGAVEISHGLLAVRSSAETVAGDANLDGEFDISDPIAVLGHLFLGAREPLCSPAADYERDGELIISDPIRMLGVLFGGYPAPVGASGRIDCRR